MAEQEADVTSQAPEKNHDPYVSESATQPQIAAAPGPSGEPGRPDEKRMSFLEHLVELRVRLRNAALAFLVTMIGSFIFVQHYFDWLTRPVRRGLRDAGHEMNFYAKSLTEPFWVYMKLAIVGGLLISAPFIFWELWRFVAPGLYRKERRIGVLIATATGLTSTYFVNVFGAVQRREQHEAIAGRVFAAAFGNQTFVGQIRTQLGIESLAAQGPQEAALALLRLISARRS